MWTKYNLSSIKVRFPLYTCEQNTCVITGRPIMWSSSISTYKNLFKEFREVSADIQLTTVRQL
jgi:hypothetical protein